MTEHLAAGLSVEVPTMDDLEKGAKLFNAHYKFATNEEGFYAKRMEEIWAEPFFKLSGAARVVVNEAGDWVGYLAVWNTVEPYVSPYIAFRIDPAYRGKGIGTTLTAWAEQKAREDVAKAPADAKVTLAAGFEKAFEDAPAFLTERGYKEKRFFLRMAIDLDDTLKPADLPSEFRLETYAQRKDLEELIVCDDECFADHYGYVKMNPDDLRKEWDHWLKTNKYYDPNLWFVAMAGDEVAGLCLCDFGMHHDETVAYVDTVCVRKAYRKKGLASAMLRHAFLALRDRGNRVATLHVDGSSLTGATRVYERAGMREDQRSIYYDKLLRDGKSYMTETEADIR